MIRNGNLFKYKSVIFIAISLILAWIFDLLFLWYLPGISVFLYTLLIGLVVIFLNQLFRKPLSRDILLVLALACFFSAMVAIRSNGLLTALNIFATILLLLIITEINVRGRINAFKPVDYLKTLGLPFSYLIAAIDTVVTLRIPLLSSLDSKSKQIVRGILITIPVMIIFSGLLAGADPVFHSLAQWVFNFQIESADHFYVMTMVAVFSCGALAYLFRIESAFKTAAVLPRRPMGHIETAILLGSVNALFIAFIALQATYFFGGATNIVSGAYTYAEYARRGFFELITIAAFTYLILLAVEKLIERNADNHSKQFKSLSAALVVQVMIFMVFAFNRLSLYEAVYGFTTLRLYSHAFILFLALVYVFLLYKIFLDIRENTFALRVFVAIALFVASMDIINPDAFIAQMNLERFNSTGKIDYEYLAGLSSDATPVLLKIYDQTDPVAHLSLGDELYSRSIFQPDSWQSWNLSRETEHSLLSERKEALKEYITNIAPLRHSSEIKNL